MKFTKRILATLLVFVLALSLALPTAAVDWNEFRITKQPENLTIKHGDSFTLSVEVNLPTGVTDVEYQWYNRSLNPIGNATSPELHLNSGDPHYPEDSRFGGGSSAQFQVWITAYVKNASGDVVVEKRLRSNTVNVRTERTSLGKFLDVTIAPFGYAFSATIVAPGFILIFPLAYIGFLFYFYYLGLRGLFS